METLHQDIRVNMRSVRETAIDLSKRYLDENLFSCKFTAECLHPTVDLRAGWRRFLLEILTSFGKKIMSIMIIPYATKKILFM